MEIRNYKGIDALKALINGNLKQSPMAHTIPMKLVHAEPGDIIYETTPSEAHINLQGGIHGGFCATVLDSVTGAVAHSLMDAGVGFATTDLNIKMIRPMQVGHTYRGVGKLINAGRTLVTTEGTIIDEQGKVYAHASATLMILKKKSD